MTGRGAALVTGAGQRIGRAIALRLARAGFDVAVHYRSNPQAAEAVVAEIEALGRRAVALRAELTEEAAARAMVAEATQALGPLRVLVNSASAFQDDRAGRLGRETWDRHFETNLRAPLVLAQVFARRLPAEREGLIVNVLDQRVWRPGPEFFSYTLSKAALWDATRMLAQALAPRIRVNGIGPGPTLPSIHQDEAEFAAEVASTLLKRPSSPQQVGAALRYLIDAEAVTGQMIAADSGQHLA